MEEQKTHSYKFFPIVFPNAINNENSLSDPNRELLYPLRFGADSNTMIPKIHVLMIDRDKKFLNSTSELLEKYSYQVTRIDLASRAVKMISSGKKHIDVVIADVHSDVDGFQLCQQIMKHGIIVILTSAIEEAHLATKAIENGAFLFIQKPVDEHIIKYLWQFVMKERLQKSGGKEIKSGEMTSRMMVNGRGKAIVINGSKGKNKATNTSAADKEKNINRIARMEVDQGKVQKRTNKKRKEPENILINPASIKISTRESYPEVNYNRKKICTEWTKELHAKFMNAVNQLGDGKCYPKEILEIMNVPGLTRMQVASHLQKCRHDSWRAPDERKYRSRVPRYISRGNDAREKERMRVFGSMPRGEDMFQAENQQSSQNSPLHSNSASSAPTNTTAGFSNPKIGKSSGGSTVNNSKGITAFDHGNAEFATQDIPISEDDLFPSLENLNIDDILMREVDEPVSLWDDIFPVPTTYPANVFMTNPNSCFHNVTMTALAAPAAPTVELDFNQNAVPPSQASEEALEIEDFFNKHAPNFPVPFEIDNQDEKSNNNLPSFLNR